MGEERSILTAMSNNCVYSSLGILLKLDKWWFLKGQSAQSVKHVTLPPGIVSSSPMLGVRLLF